MTDEELRDTEELLRGCGAVSSCPTCQGVALKLVAEVRRLLDAVKNLADAHAASELARNQLIAAQIERDCPLPLQLVMVPPGVTPEQAQAVLDATECDR